ncbi:MAG: ATP12 family protein, partial [Pseudomonadota bacterium]
MSWTPQARPKRFYKLAEIREVDGGWTVCLDGRPIRTPAKAVFKAPQAVAEAAAAEWAAQAEEIAPDAMPVTRAVNSAIDRVAPQDPPQGRIGACLGRMADNGPGAAIAADLDPAAIGQAGLKTLDGEERHAHRPSRLRIKRAIGNGQPPATHAVIQDRHNLGPAEGLIAGGPVGDTEKA